MVYEFPQFLSTPRAPVALVLRRTSYSPHEALRFQKGGKAARYHAARYRGGYEDDLANSVVQHPFWL
jgi:hypothetical protein